MQCETCFGEEFDELDGHFYCTTCLTQSQNNRVEEEDEDFVEQPNSIVRRKIKSKVEKKETTKDVGRPWHTYEAFQIIILEQVKALIGLGANPLLKEVVFRLWCKFLQKTGIAFPEKPNNPLLSRHREMFPGTRSDPLIKPIRVRDTNRKRYGISMKTAEIENMNQELLATLENEDFYDEDMPDIVGGSKEEEEEAQNLEEESEASNDEDDEEETARKIRIHTNMNMPKTLCFCYLGLVFCKSLASPSDLVRWVDEDKVPYLKATKLLPQDMKFGPYDCLAFGGGRLQRMTVDKLLFMSGKVAQIVGLRDVGSQLPPVTLYINKLIVRMELPGELHGLAQSLWTRTCERHKMESNRMENRELVAMGCIIILISMVFGLDDNVEYYISRCTNHLHKLIGKDVGLFNWEEWMSYWDKKMFVTRNNQVTSQYINTREVYDVGRYIDNMRKSSKDIRTCPWELKALDATRSVNKEVIQGILKPVHSLEKKLTDKNHGDDTPSSSCSGGFKSKSVKHITQSDTFIDNLRTSHNISDFDKVKAAVDRISNVYNELTLKLMDSELSDQSASYRWLVDYASHVILCPPEDIHIQVSNLIDVLRKDKSLKVLASK